MRRLARMLALSLGVAAAATALAATATGQRAAVVDRFQPAAPASGDIVVVTADRRFTAMMELNPFDILGPLVERAATAGAAAIVLEPDLMRLVQERLAITAPGQFEDILQVATDQLGNLVSASVVGDLEDPTGDGIPRLARPVPRGLLAEGSIATGFSTPVPVGSGAPERTIPILAQRHEDEATDGVIPAVPLVALLAADGAQGSVDGRIDDGTAVLDGRRVRVEGGSRLRINYADELLPGGSSVFDAVGFATGETSLDEVAGAVVFVGLVDPSYAQLFPVAAGDHQQLPMVFVNANAANTIATGSYLSPPSTWAGVMLGLLGAALVTLAALAVPLWLAPVVTGAALVGLWSLERARVDAGEPFDLLLAAVAVAAAGIAVMAMRVIELATARRRAAALFARYVPDTVARQLLSSGWVEGGSDRVEVATFFCDLRGFTPVAAALSPDDVRRLLDRFYEYVAGAVLDAGGTVMQFVGDEVFAVFGAPLPTVGCPEAFTVASSVLSGGDGFRASLADHGLPPIEWGIGLHYGPVVAAHVGTSRRRQYSVVGDTVNVGSRLCGQAAAGEAVMSEAFWLAAGQPEAEPRGPLTLKGVGGGVNAYRITGGALISSAG